MTSAFLATARRAWVTGSRPGTAVSLTLLAISMVLFARAAANWRYILWVNDTARSAAPAAYGSEWPSLGSVMRRQQSMWVVVVHQPALPAACAQMARGRASGVTLIALTGDSTFSVARCTEAGGPIVTPERLALDGPEIAAATRLAPNGFVVTDSSRRVVYGSMQLNNISRIASVISLFRGT